MAWTRTVGWDGAKRNPSIRCFETFEASVARISGAPSRTTSTPPPHNHRVQNMLICICVAPHWMTPSPDGASLVQATGGLLMAPYRRNRVPGGACFWIAPPSPSRGLGVLRHGYQRSPGRRGTACRAPTTYRAPTFFQENWSPRSTPTLSHWL